MRLLYSTSQWMAISASVLLAASCIKPANDRDARDGNNVYSNCRINAISSIYMPARQFEYNSNNDPISVKTASPGTGSPNLAFQYDSKHNLTEYTGFYSDNTNFEFMHRYGYRQNRITTDTMWVFGSKNYPDASWSKRIKYLQYDALNRVVTDSEAYVYPNTFINVLRFQYDADGNLLTNNEYNNYDKKLNPHRTNRIWMFIDRNYSLNNPVAAISYNSSGLPLSIETSGKYDANIVLAYTYYYGLTTISYNCR